MLRSPLRDARELAVAARDPGWKGALRVALRHDSFKITTVQRLRELVRWLHLPLLNHLLRVVQTLCWGIEINNGVELGAGVYFVHPFAIVIGGTSRVGDRVRFYGSNTLGTIRDDGYPVVEEDVVIGAGARILGPVRVGARSLIGANAVVIEDVPPDHVAVGVPARLHRRKDAPAPVAAAVAADAAE